MTELERALMYSLADQTKQLMTLAKRVNELAQLFEQQESIFLSLESQVAGLRNRMRALE